ncbi:hypothetical protein [Frankia sp. R82]|uniref:hypothetical protein n=1 Tax=Frankia sp. R82 TaxID=2950553 RepID=UPI00204421C7|nr:hypothetical protein [Frankia sp. R82]MCM3882336.1 hypothetical protein [Frankia sp. R82]
MKAIFVAPQTPVESALAHRRPPVPVPAGPAAAESARPPAVAATDPVTAATGQSEPARTPTGPVRAITIVVRHPALNLTATMVAAEVAIGAVAVARQLARRGPAPRAYVRMGPGGWVSLRGGSVRTRGGPHRTGHGHRHPVPGWLRGRRTR